VILLLHRTPDGTLAVTTEVVPGATTFPSDWVRLPDQESSALEQVRIAPIEAAAYWNAVFQRVECDVQAARTIKITLAKEEASRRLSLCTPKKIELDEFGSAQERLDMATYRQDVYDCPRKATEALSLLSTPPEIAAYVPPWPVYPF
jgi:hypothetical protein